MEPAIHLRKVEAEDLAELFAQQLEYAPVPDDFPTFNARWSKILSTPGTPVRTIVAKGLVVGYIANFQRNGRREVSYCVGKQYWGNGFATNALRLLLDEIDVRPLYARVAKHNARSIRVLQKCGFAIVGEDRFADRRGAQVEEYIFALGEPEPS